jgi:hypothetical protein
MKLGDILSRRAIRSREPQQQPVVELFSGIRVAEPAPARQMRGR